MQKCLEVESQIQDQLGVDPSRQDCASARNLTRALRAPFCFSASTPRCRIAPRGSASTQPDRPSERGL